MLHNEKKGRSLSFHLPHVFKVIMYSAGTVCLETR